MHHAPCTQPAGAKAHVTTDRAKATIRAQAYLCVHSLCPLSPPQPVLDEEQQLRLGRPKYRVTLLPPSAPAAKQQADEPQQAEGTAPGCRQGPAARRTPALQLVGPTSIFEQAWGLTGSQQPLKIEDSDGGSPSTDAALDSDSSTRIVSLQAMQEAAAAAYAFRAVAAYASGTYDPALHGAFPPAPAWACGVHGSAQQEGLDPSSPGSSQQQEHETEPPAASSCSSSSYGSGYGSWRPFLAPVRANTRLTSADHFQDTRHIAFDLRGSGLSHEPGDLLSVLPM